MRICSLAKDSSIITSHPSQSDIKDIESAVTRSTPTTVSLLIMEGHIAYQHQYYLSKVNIGDLVVIIPSKHKKQVSQLIPRHVDINQA